jgi:hypothetical protein
MLEPILTSELQGATGSRRPVATGLRSSALSVSVTYFLHASFPNKCVGRSGHIGWPPLSPDLTPLYFHF